MDRGSFREVAFQDPNRWLPVKALGKYGRRLSSRHGGAQNTRAGIGKPYFEHPHPVKGAAGFRNRGRFGNRHPMPPKKGCTAFQIASVSSPIRLRKSVGNAPQSKSACSR